jgi:hypothetical protein
MATKFVTNLDLNGNQILNGRLEALSADPTTGNFEGRLIYRTDLDCIKVHDGASWKVLLKSVTSGGDHAASLTVSESGGAITITPNLATGSASGLLSSGFYNDLNNATSASTGGTIAKRDVDGRIQVATPSNDSDAATKAYVDAARSGLDVKQSVRAATTGPLTLASDFEAGDTLDTTVTLAAGDRILIKNQTDASENGIYVVNETGAPTRAPDADQNFEVTPGMFLFVEEGTVNADSGWVLTTDGTITVGTTGLVFAQFSGAGQIVAGDGLVKTGNVLDVVGTADRIIANANSIDIASTYVGQTSITTLGTVTTGTWNGTDVAVADGGTGSSTASGARTNLASTAEGFSTSTPVLARVSAQTIGDNSNTSFVVTHNFGTRDVIVQVYDVSTYDTVITDVVRTDTNSVTVTFSSAPPNSSYKVVVTG